MYDVADELHLQVLERTQCWLSRKKRRRQTQSGEQDTEEGERFVIFGLAGAPELNGVAVRQAGPEEDGRVPVKPDVHWQNRSACGLKVRPKNLRPFEPADASALGEDSDGTGFSDSDDEDTNDEDATENRPMETDEGVSFGVEPETPSLHPDVQRLLVELTRRVPAREVATTLDTLAHKAISSTVIRECWSPNDLAAAIAACLAQLRRRTTRISLQEWAGYRGDKAAERMFVIKHNRADVKQHEYAPRYTGLIFDKALRAVSTLLLTIGDDVHAKAAVVRLLGRMRGGTALKALLTAAAPHERHSRPRTALAGSVGIFPEGAAYPENTIPENAWLALAILSSGAVPGTPAPAETLRELLWAGAGTVVRRRLRNMEDGDAWDHGEADAYGMKEPFDAHLEGLPLREARNATRRLASLADREPFEEQLAEQDTADAHMLHTLANLCAVPEGCALFLDNRPDAVDGQYGYTYITLKNYLVARAHQAREQFENGDLAKAARAEGGPMQFEAMDPTLVDFLLFSSPETAASEHRRSNNLRRCLRFTPIGDPAEAPATHLHIGLPPMLCASLAAERIGAEFRARPQSPAVATVCHGVISRHEDLKKEDHGYLGHVAQLCVAVMTAVADFAVVPEGTREEAEFVDDDGGAVLAAYCSFALGFLECWGGRCALPDLSGGAATGVENSAAEWQWEDLAADLASGADDPAALACVAEWTARIRSVRARLLLLTCDAAAPRKGLWVAPRTSSVGGDGAHASVQVCRGRTRHGFVSTAVADAKAARNTQSAFLRRTAEFLSQAAAAVTEEADAGAAGGADDAAALGSGSDSEEEMGGAQEMGMSKMHQLAMQGKTERLQKLLSRPASKRGHVDTRNAMQETPMIMAACYGHTECVTLLAKAGADPTLADCSGNTALMRAHTSVFASDKEACAAAVDDALEAWQSVHGWDSSLTGLH
eukprot:gene20713-24823_t